MSVFRSLVLKKGALRYASNHCLIKLNLDLSITQRNNYNCKALLTLPSLRREYSTQNKDKETENEVIYTGFLSKNIRNIKLFSLSTSVIGIAIQPIVYTRAVEAGTATTLTLPVFGFIGLFAIVTPLLLNYVTKRYVLSVDYNSKEDKYIATYYNLFAMKREIEFTPEDVTIPTVLGMFTSCAIKGKPVFLDVKYFTDERHYGRIMGYDKPLDLLVDDKTDSDKVTSQEKN